MESKEYLEQCDSKRAKWEKELSLLMFIWPRVKGEDVEVVNAGCCLLVVKKLIVLGHNVIEKSCYHWW